MALLNNDSLKTLVAIGRLDAKQKFICEATGFLIAFIVKNSKDIKKRTYRIFIATNRHVFEDKKVVYLRFNKENDKPHIAETPLYYPSGESKWLKHKNNLVDLALLALNINKINDLGLDYSVFNEEMFAKCSDFNKIGIAMGDDVYIIGFPMGIAGIKQNYPYVKSGTISRFDKEILKDKKAYLIDSSIFPGNSGSPVLLKPTITALEKTTAVSGIYVLGVVSGYVPYVEKLYSIQTKKVVSEISENSGLSSVVPMEYISQIYKSWLRSNKKLEKAETNIETAQKTLQTQSSQV